MGLSQINLITTLFFAVLVFPATISKAQNQYLFPALLSLDKSIFAFSRPNFTSRDYPYLNISGDASINNKAIQLTPDSINDNFTLFHKSGRSMFLQSFKLYEFKDDRILSFNSTFLMNAFPTRIGPNSSEKASGDGLAFVIASDSETPPGSSDGFLGLTNNTHDGNSSNKFIAIEFDTIKNDENGDPNNNHLGLNINSVISKNTVNLTQYNITIAPLEATKYRVWILYNGTTKMLDVYMVLEGSPKPKAPLLSERLDFKDLKLSQYSYFGFSGSTGATAQLNCILSWDLNVEIIPEEPNAKNLKLLKILVGAGIPGVLILMICVVGLGYYLHKCSVKDDMSILGALKSLPGMPREFTFKELKKATNNFDEKMKLGQGGFGVVYKGVLPNDFEYTEIAVKKFLRESLKSKFDFLSELTIINRLRHKHLVRLAGWCHKNGVLLLVYEFMPNGSLDHHLYGGSDTNLGWNHRYKITYGVASALEYLHNGYEQIVLHRDLKASNIMLDSDYNARLGDFGLARVIEHERSSFGELEGFAGTLGYIAPECFLTRKSTKESDVFGFGAVVLELICGKRPWTSFQEFESLVDWVWKLHGEERILEAIDVRLENVYVVEEARRLLLLGLACSHPIAGERPKTETIFQIISGSVPVPSISPQKPQFVWPSMGISSSSIDESKIMTNNEEDEMPMLSAYYTSRHSVFVPTATTMKDDKTPLTSSYYTARHSVFVPIATTTTSNSASITMKDVNIDESHHSLQIPTMQLRMKLHSTKKGSMKVGRQYSAFVMAMITGRESIKFADVQKFLLHQEMQLAMESSHASNDYDETRS